MSNTKFTDLIIQKFPLPKDSTSSDLSRFEFLATVTLAAEEEDIDSSAATRKSIWKNRDKASQLLVSNHFTDEPTFDDATFRLRYHMSMSLFLKFVKDITDQFEWFWEGIDAARQKSFAPTQKCTCTIRQLAYGNVADNFDETLAMSARTSHECLEFFCNAIIKLYGEEFLRSPTSHDIVRLYEANENKHHFLGMISSIDCTNWVWRNCSMALRGQCHHQYPIIILEAVSSPDLWFWHAYFGVVVSNNGTKVIMQSPLFNPEMHGKAPELGFSVNGWQYKRGYYLADGTENLQKAARKDVERAYGVIKVKFAILSQPPCMKKKQKIVNMMYACIVLHNLIIKDDGNVISLVYIRDPPTAPNVNPNFGWELLNEETHYTLHRDITEHIASLNLDVEVDE